MSALLIDLFAGGGGASLGIERALGRPIDLAVNHNPRAISLHTRHHPHTRHEAADVWAVSPTEACAGRPVDLLWLSPACTHFSRAKGAQNPKSAKIRSLASVAIRWAREVKPRVICLENVEEFAQWGPVDNAGRPIASKRGRSFRCWVGKLRSQGYTVEWRSLVAADYGAPTSRRRLYLIARCDGERIRWPNPTHGKGLAPWRTAAECIDWSIPCPSIFARTRPLVDATLRRIAAGLRRYVLCDLRSGAVPYLIQTGYGEREGQAPRVLNINAPLGTIVASAKHALVTAFISKTYGGGPNGVQSPGSSLTLPLGTVTAIDHNALVAVQLGHSRRPEVDAFLVKYYGADGRADSQQSLLTPLHTVTTRARFGLVTVDRAEYQIEDIGMRMLTPAELWTAQGFPRDFDCSGYTATEQIALCGNSVVPAVAEAIVRANVLGDALRRVA